MELLTVIGLMLVSVPVAWLLWRLTRHRSCNAVGAAITSYFLVCGGLVIAIKELVPAVRSEHQLAMMVTMFLGVPGALAMARRLNPARPRGDKSDLSR